MTRGTIDRKQMKPEAPRDPLVGMALHTWKNGAPEFQGRIDSVDGDMVLVQLYSWMFGEPTEIRTFWKSYIYSDKVTLYRNCEQMRGAYDKHAERYERNSRPVPR